MSMRVLVVGGAGYIGSHTAKALHQAGYTPVVFDNLSMGHRWAVKWGPLVEGDLLDPSALLAALQDGVQAVIHSAANAYVGESMEQPGKYFCNNVVGTLNLLEAMRETGVQHIVFSSSCATYGIPQQIPIAETHPQDPINPTVSPSGWGSGCFAGLASVTACAGWPCVISTPPGPTLRASWERCTSPKPTSSPW